eukprot:10573-Heterococcus_DN1.PRE.7
MRATAEQKYSWHSSASNALRPVCYDKMCSSRAAHSTLLQCYQCEACATTAVMVVLCHAETMHIRTATTAHSISSGTARMQHFSVTVCIALSMAQSVFTTSK